MKSITSAEIGAAAVTIIRTSPPKLVLILLKTKLSQTL